MVGPPKFPNPAKPMPLVVAEAPRVPKPVAEDDGAVPKVVPPPKPRVEPAVLKVLVLLVAAPKAVAAGAPKPVVVPKPVDCVVELPKSVGAEVAGVPKPKDVEPKPAEIYLYC